MKLKITSLLCLFLCLKAFSQRRVADKFYKNYAYPKAAELYQLVVKRGDSSVNILTRLADCYYNNAEPNRAIYWYNLVFKKSDAIDDEYIYKYAQSLKSVGRYSEAVVLLKRIKTKGKESSSELYNYYEKLQKLNKDSVNVVNASINTKNSDFGAFLFKDKLYFSSAMNEKGKIYEWNNQPYLDLYEADVIKKDKETKLKDVNLLTSKKVNTSYHEANVAITKDGKTMYFTRNNLTKRKKLDYDKKGTSHLKIFKATLVDGYWDNIEELPFNNEVISNGHPALSPDEKTLYYTSDKPGGYGLTDIYKVSILNGGLSYGEPENLGPKINTKGREMFPFVSSDNTFYFSSDNYENLGFLDIFKSDILNDSEAKVVNLGAPFNSGYDDFSFFIDNNNMSGYFSSNRPGGKGDDDIYSFESYVCKQYIKGKTFDAKTKEVLPKTLVQLIDANGKVLDTVTSSEKGDYFFEVDCESAYILRAAKKDYKDALANVVTSNINNKKNEQDLYLTPLIIDKEIVINPIFFDFDKWNIRSDAAFELENIVDVLKNHPKMVIKIEAHTDSRGVDSYNMLLSDRRAKSTRDYILSRNIETNRIQSAIGFGESLLVNKCKNGIKCSEEEHQENRRSKFIILTTDE